MRVTLDRGLEYFREEPDLMERNAWRSTAGYRCKDDAKRQTFPYCVLEIKLREEFIKTPPAWLQEITGSSAALDDEEEAGGLVTPVFKYSKFGSAVFSLYNHKNIFMPFWVEPRMDELLPFTIHSNHHRDMTRPSGAVVVAAMTSTSNASDSQVSSLGEDAEEGHDVVIDVSAAACEGKENKNRGIAWLSKNRVSTPPSQIGGLAVRSVKVEPKTFFANERTYLQWFSAATFVMGFGIALLEFSSQGQILGIVLIVYAGIMSLFALGVYYYRLRSILKHDKHAIFYDVWGPPILSVGLFVAVGLGLLFDFLDDGVIGDAALQNTGNVGNGMSNVMNLAR